MNQPSPQPLLEACQARTPLQFKVESPDRREKTRYSVPLPFALIGRNERSEIPLPDENVSYRHAYLQVVSGRLWCIDLDSRSGTHWAKTGNGPDGLLHRGQGMRIGPYIVRALDGCGDEVEDPSLLTSPLLREFSDPASTPCVSLHFLDGSTQQTLWMVDRALTLVGRSPVCKIRLHSPTVSRTHCALLRTENKLWVIDLLGRGGTYVNEEPVRWALLNDGDEVRIGQFLIRACFLDRPKRAASTSFYLSGPQSNPAAENLLPPASAMNGSPSLPMGMMDLLQPAMQFASPTSAVTPVNNSKPSESLLMPLVQQFSLMQQQMFDQFQQALTMMVQMFSGLHRDQLQLIRQELGQLHSLTHELKSLQVELGKRSPQAIAVDTPTPTPTRSAPAARRPAAAAPRKTPPARPAPSPSAPTITTAALDETATVPALGATPTPPPEVRSDAEVHAWLANRLATLQQERQTRLTKILKVLTG